MTYGRPHSLEGPDGAALSARDRKTEAVRLREQAAGQGGDERASHMRAGAHRRAGTRWRDKARGGRRQGVRAEGLRAGHTKRAE